MSSLEERVSWTRDAVLERSRPRVAQRETYSRRSGSRPPFVDVALSALRSDLHDPLSEQAMKSNMAGEGDLRNTVCLLQSRCATRGHHSPHHRQATGFRREGINRIRAPTHIAKHTFNGVGAADIAVHHRRESVKGQEMLFILREAAHCFGIAQAVFGECSRSD